MTPNTVSIAAPAPSVASDKAKQLASLASRVGRLSALSTSRCNGRPISQVELAFLMRPVAGETVPGMPIPTGAVVPISCSIILIKAMIASTVPP
jgi:hypothetical protein